MKTEFKLFQKIKIIPLEDWDGVIIGIWIAEKGISYQVRYFNSGEAKEVYFYPDELKEIPNERD